MKSIVVLLFLGIAKANDATLEEFAAGNRLFSAAVYKELAAFESGNFLVCPVSVETVVALVELGARGKTAEEIINGLDFPRDHETLQQSFLQLVKSLKRSDRYTLSSANKIYVQKDFKIDPIYQSVANRVFGASVENINFRQKLEAADVINNWVEGQTNNKIQGLMSPNDLDDETKMVLVNALYFKAKWQNQFEVFSTVKQPFYTSEKNSVEVKMMHTIDTFNYYENAELDAKFLELPYVGGDVSLTVVLPNTRGGLNRLEQRINDIFAPQPYKQERVQVALPKFSIESSIQFVPILQKFGVRKAFGGEADFSGITGFDNDLYISKIIQKTFINVTEVGTEAAAATAGGAVTLSIPYQPPMAQLIFLADHPFLFYLKTKSGITLFAGRYNQPNPSFRY